MEDISILNDVLAKIKTSNPAYIENVCIQTLDKDALSDISSYYLIESNGLSKKSSIFKNLTLFVVSATSMWLFYSTSGLIANDDESLKIKLIVGGMSINFLVTWNTSEAFIEHIRSKQFPSKLLRYADVNQIKNEKIKLVLVTLGAFINAIPISLAVFTNNTKINAYLITETIVTQIDNTFIHTFPTLIVAQNTILRSIFLLPVLPIFGIYYFVKYIKNSIYPDQSLHTLDLQLETKFRNHQKLKSALIKTLASARENISKDCFEFIWFNRNSRFSFNVLSFETHLSNDLLQINNQYGLEYLIKIASKSSYNYNQNSKSFNLIINTIIGWLFYIAGTLLINIAIMGFYKNTYDDIPWVTNKYFKLGLSLYPNMLLSILVSYFAARFFRNILFEGVILAPLKFVYDAINYCITGRPITTDLIPTAAKNYFKTTLIFIGVAFYLSYYSYGTALGLLQKHLTEEFFKNLLPCLTYFTIYGMLVFNYKNAIEFILNKTAQLAIFSSNQDKKSFKVLLDKISKIMIFIENMDGDQLETSLRAKSENELYTLTGLKQPDFQKLCDHLPKQTQQRSYWPFWKSKDLPEEKTRLLDDEQPRNRNSFSNAI